MCSSYRVVCFSMGVLLSCSRLIPGIYLQGLGFGKQRYSFWAWPGGLGKHRFTVYCDHILEGFWFASIFLGVSFFFAATLWRVGSCKSVLWSIGAQPDGMSPAQFGTRRRPRARQRIWRRCGRSCGRLGSASRICSRRGAPWKHWVGFLSEESTGESRSKASGRLECDETQNKATRCVEHRRALASWCPPRNCRQQPVANKERKRNKQPEFRSGEQHLVKIVGPPTYVCSFCCLLSYPSKGYPKTKHTHTHTHIFLRPVQPWQELARAKHEASGSLTRGRVIHSSGAAASF